MRAAFIISVIAIASVAAHPNLKRQEESATEVPATEPTTTTEPTSSTIVDSSPGSSTPTGGASSCAQVCDSASTVYSGCHNDSDSLRCFCQSSSINTLAACAACKRTAGAVDEAAPLEEQIGGIIDACNARSVSVASPSQITITRTASVGNPSQITAPAAAKITSKSTSASGSKSASGSSPSTSTKAGNSASGAFDVSLAGVVGAGVVAFFL